MRKPPEDRYFLGTVRDETRINRREPFPCSKTGGTAVSAVILVPICWPQAGRLCYGLYGEIGFKFPVTGSSVTGSSVTGSRVV